MGLGDASSPAPQVSFDYDYTDSDGSLADSLVVTICSSDTFEARNAKVVVDGNENELGGSGAPFSATKIVSAGDPFEINAGAGGAISESVNPGDQVDITFTPEDGGESNVLGSFRPPED